MAMTSWHDVETAAPDLARLVRTRIEATGLAFLATLRADGSPRISGIEPLFAGGEVWLGSMPGARKSADLQRDPRMALHNATVDKEVRDGDVKVSGRAVLVEGDEAQATARAAFESQTGNPPPAGPFDLFRVDITEIASVRPGAGPSGETDHLAIDWWTVGGGLRHVERR